MRGQRRTTRGHFLFSQVEERPTDRDGGCHFHQREFDYIPHHLGLGPLPVWLQRRERSTLPLNDKQIWPLATLYFFQGAGSWPLLDCLILGNLVPLLAMAHSTWTILKHLCWWWWVLTTKSGLKFVVLIRKWYHFFRVAIKLVHLGVACF